MIARKQQDFLSITSKKTYDPAERYDKINKFLSSEFFLDKHKFSDALFATFPKKNKSRRVGEKMNC